ncbi:MAG: hypothetical protein RR318_07910, partial [Alistipes sp.]
MRFSRSLAAHTAPAFADRENVLCPALFCSAHRENDGVCRKVGFSVKKRGRFVYKPAQSPVLGKFNFPDRHFRPALFFVAFSKESKEKKDP